MINHCCPVKNQTSILIKILPQAGGPLTCPAAEFQQKGLPQITQIFADWFSAFISAICGQQEAGTGSNRSRFPHKMKFQA